MASQPSIQPWGGRRARAALARVKARGARNQTPCCLCEAPIDYRLSYPDPWSCSVEHVLSRLTHPELTWDPGNHAPAHLQCNISAKKPRVQVAGPPPDLGLRSGW